MEIIFFSCNSPRNPLQATSVWVGNLTTNIEKEMLYPHFMRYEKLEQKLKNELFLILYKQF